MKLAPQLSNRCSVLFGDIRLVSDKPRAAYKLPAPRPLPFHKVRETCGQHVVEAYITVGFGPWKRQIRSFIFGGQWIARAASNSQ